MPNRHFAVRAAVLRAMEEQRITYAQMARRIGWPVSWLTSRLGDRGPLTGSEVRHFAEAFGLAAPLQLLEAIACHELGGGYLYTITCCELELDVYLGREILCPRCGSTFAAHLEKAA